MYPIKFENLYYDKVWGGRDLEDFRENLPEGNIGESWDIACHPNGIGVVANGEFKGMTFNELIEKHKDEIFGKSLINEEFLLLVKLINSIDVLPITANRLATSISIKLELSLLLMASRTWFLVYARSYSYDPSSLTMRW